MYCLYLGVKYIHICTVHIVCISTPPNAYVCIVCIVCIGMYPYLPILYIHTDTYGYRQYRHIQAIQEYIQYIQIHTDTYRYCRYIHIHTIYTDTYVYESRKTIQTDTYNANIQTYSYKYIHIHTNTRRYNQMHDPGVERPTLNPKS